MKPGFVAVQVSPAQQARLGIMRHAYDCEDALRLADFATGESLSPEIATGLRKLAEYHSEHAFKWAARLVHVEAAS